MQTPPREVTSVLTSPPEYRTTSRVPAGLSAGLPADFPSESFEPSEAGFALTPHAPLAPELEQMLARLGSDGVDTLLLALAEQTRALRLVLEAQERGAIALPRGLAERVAAAARQLPTFLAPLPSLAD